MRRVTLAYPYEGHEPDETIELPDVIARRLLHHGRARRADDEVAAEREAAEAAAAEATEEPKPPREDPPFNYMTIPELRAFAQQHEIDIPEDVRKRPAIAELVRAAWTREPAPETAPVTGTDQEEAPDGR